MATATHTPTPQSRQRILDLLKAGLVIDRVAEVIGISARSVARHYKAEIEAAGVRPGPAAHVPTDATRKMVELMAAAGILQDEIAEALEMSAGSLRTHYRKELNTA